MAIKKATAKKAIAKKAIAKKATAKKAKPSIEYEGKTLFLKKAQYCDGNTAILVTTKSGSEYARLTTNIGDFQLPPNAAFIDTNNNPLPLVLACENAGYIKDTGAVVPSGFCAYRIYEVLF